MPEELAIGLILLVAAGWIVLKILQAMAGAAESVFEQCSGYVSRYKAAKFQKQKAKLLPHAKIVVPEELDSIRRQLDEIEVRFRKKQTDTTWTPNRPLWTKQEFRPRRAPSQREGYTAFDIADIESILRQNAPILLDQETLLTSQSCAYPFPPPSVVDPTFVPFPELDLGVRTAEFTFSDLSISTQRVAKYFGDEQRAVRAYNDHLSSLIAKRDFLKKQIEEWNESSKLEFEIYTRREEALLCEEMESFNLISKRYTLECQEQKTHFTTILNEYKQGAKSGVTAQMNYVMDNLSLPKSVPRAWEIEFDDAERILIVEIGLPDVVHLQPFKTVTLKSGEARKPLNQGERKELIPKIHPAILLRVAFEIFRNDPEEIINLLVLNGWVEFNDPTSGLKTKAYTAAVMVNRSQVVSLNLPKIEPLAAFTNLHGQSAGRIIEIIPIEPTLSLDRRDGRFVDSKAILDGLEQTTNLASMDWQDFEHLIRELFEREFSGRGVEVKITQASRDRGVDAIAFDPDPIRGGKFVIQAKRYSNTVDVSAVRDLCAVVQKEGASRGILVTTSTFGVDAYTFADNEPVTLLNGSELLGLLRKHGYSFRIDLKEARRLSTMHMRREKH